MVNKNMTSQEKKEYLKKYNNPIGEIESITMRRDGLYNISGQKLSGMPSGMSKSPDKITDYLSDILAMEEKFQEKESRISKLINKSILDAISNLENSIERKVLTLKYIYGLGWDKVIETMRYSKTQTLKYHGDALQNLIIDCVDEKEPV